MKLFMYLILPIIMTLLVVAIFVFPKHLGEVSIVYASCSDIIWWMYWHRKTRKTK